MRCSKISLNIKYDEKEIISYILSNLSFKGYFNKIISKCCATFDIQIEDLVFKSVQDLFERSYVDIYIFFVPKSIKFIFSLQNINKRAPA